MLALILAGGDGSRLGLGEKALVPVCGKPMIARVTEAFLGAGCEPVVVTSHKTPYTKNWCRAFGLSYLDTAGAGYVEDLGEAVEMTGEEGALFTSAADIPALTSSVIRRIRDAHAASGKPACSVWVPAAYQMEPRYLREIDGVPATPCALNIITGNSAQDELVLLLDEPGLALNINTREDLARAENSSLFASHRYSDDAFTGDRTPGPYC
jgi:adenosylcobinamide-phosphate guanylyltransferase